MKYLTILFFLLCVFSCNYFERKKISSEEILKEDLQTFNWNEVDEYPTFTICDTTSTKVERRQCFESILTAHISSQLAKKVIVVTQDVNDTILIKFLISEKGILSVLELKSSDHVKLQIPEIDSLLIKSLTGLPQILPAFKRGQHVKTEFKLPVIINAN